MRAVHRRAGKSQLLKNGASCSYGPRITESYQGVYVGHIINGAKPIDLPVLHRRIVINLKTTKALGLTHTVWLNHSPMG